MCIEAMAELWFARLNDVDAHMFTMYTMAKYQRLDLATEIDESDMKTEFKTTTTTKKKKKKEENEKKNAHTKSTEFKNVCY